MFVSLCVGARVPVFNPSTVVGFFNERVREIDNESVIVRRLYGDGSGRGGKLPYTRYVIRGVMENFSFFFFPIPRPMGKTVLI